MASSIVAYNDVDEFRLPTTSNFIHSKTEVTRMSCVCSHSSVLDIICPIKDGEHTIEMIQLEDKVVRSSQYVIINFDYSKIEEKCMNSATEMTNIEKNGQAFDEEKFLKQYAIDNITSEKIIDKQANDCIHLPEEMKHKREYVEEQLCEFDLNLTDVTLPDELSSLQVILTKLNGVDEIVEHFCTPQNTLGIPFYTSKPGMYLVRVTKCGKPVRGSPFTVFVEEDILDKRQQSSEYTAIVGKTCEVTFDIPQLNLTEELQELKCVLLTPEGENSHLEYTSIDSNTLRVNFTPQEQGRHIISIIRKGSHVTGSPFLVNVTDNEQNSERICEVYLDIPDIVLPRDLDKLQASLTLENGEKIGLKCSCSVDGKLGITFATVRPGKLLIDINKNGVPVQGSPFSISIENEIPDEDINPTESANSVLYTCTKPQLTKEANKLQKSSFTSTNGYIVPNNDNFNVTLVKPNGDVERLKNTKRNSSTLMITPEETGKYCIDASIDGYQVIGSPFTLTVDDMPLPRDYDVECNGNIDTKRLSDDSRILEATLSWIDEEGRDPIKCLFSCDNNFSLLYIDKECDIHIFKVLNKGLSGTLSITDTSNGDPSNDEKYNINFDVPDTPFPIHISILDATLSKLNAEVINGSSNGNGIPNSFACLNLIPKQMGVYSVNVMRGGGPIFGSPFLVTIKEEN